MLYEVITPVRRTQVPDNVRHVWNRMNQIIIEYMLERYPDPREHLVLAGEASLDATWPLTSPGVPSIRIVITSYSIHYTKLYEQRYAFIF